MDEKGIELEKLIAYGSKEAVLQNLEDAGCPPDIVACCISCMEEGKKQELLKRLEEHRKGLLHKVHEVKCQPENKSCIEEKQIDCLDYLVYQISRCYNE